MKIHILTQPLGHNYGGNLQAYALQQVLKALGHDVMTLDRHWNLPKVGGKLLCMRILSSLKAVLFTLLGHKRNISDPFSREYNVFLDKKAIRRFVETRLCLSSPLYGTEETAEYIRKNPADCYIVGSDQVWRRAYCPSIPDYYLSPVPEDVTKISYAASFGKDDIDEYSDEELKIARNLIHRFKAISVREESGITICKDQFDIKATKVLDPTLLLTSTEYLELLERSERPKKEHYIGVYLLDNSQVKQQIIKETSSELNLTTNEITVNQKYSQYYKYPRVEDWIANIAYSDFVITDSFHGMVFSILFEKQFLALDNSSRGTARFKSLLSQLGISERLVSSASSVPTSKIDYEIVNKNLQAARQESLNWLQSQLA